jgi:hypothetical protein
VLVGWLGRVPARILGLAGAVTGLTIVQSLLLIPYHMNIQGPLRAISGLHALNAPSSSGSHCSLWREPVAGQSEQTQTAR